MNDNHQPYVRITSSGSNVIVFVFLGALYIVTFGCLWTLRDWPLLALSAVLIPMLVWLSVCDLRTFELPDFGTATIALIGAVFVASTDLQSITLHIGTGVIVTAFLWGIGECYFRYTSQECLGIGDAKLFGAGSILLGPWHLPELFLMSSLGGVLGYAVSRVLSSKGEEGIPFGPYIAYAIFVLSFLEPLFL